MDVPQYITPLQRQALAAALSSPTHALERHGGAWRAAGATPRPRISAPVPVPTFTYRMMGMLEREYLVEFDDPRFPSRATLTEKGLRIARQLEAAAGPKAGAA